MSNYLHKPIFFILFVVSISIVGCNGESTPISPSQTAVSVPTDTPLPTKTPVFTPTPLPPVGILLAPPEAEIQIVDHIQASFSAAVTEVGYRFQIRPSLSAEDFVQNQIELIVAVPPNSDISQLIRDHPTTRFLTLGFQGLDPAPNLTTIGNEDNRLDQYGFIAGYTAALITPDWRVGVIGLSGNQSTFEARQAFFAGVKYYCGLCLPQYPPFYEYPLYFELGPEATSDEWRAAADYMLQRVVETVYIVPGAGDNEMLRYLAQSGVNMIGGKNNLQEISDQWVMSLDFDLLQSYDEHIIDFVADTSDNAIAVPLSISEVNYDLLSPGRLRLVEEVMAAVFAGYIDLGITD